MDSHQATATDIARILRVSPRLGEMVRLLVLNEREIMRVDIGRLTLDFAHEQIKVSLTQSLPGSHER